MPMLSNDRHELFAQELATGGHKSNGDAYIAAGYKAKPGDSADVAASICLRKFKNIGERVKELQSRVATGLVLTRQKILEMLVEDRADAREAGQFSAAIKADELLGKETEDGMFKNKTETTIKFSEMTEAQLNARIASALAFFHDQGNLGGVADAPGGEEAPARTH